MINKHLENIQYSRNPRITNLNSDIIVYQQTIDKCFKEVFVRRVSVGWFYVSDKSVNL